MREKQLKCIEKIGVCFFFGQSLELDIHLFEDGGSMHNTAIWYHPLWLILSKELTSTYATAVC
jgi:hypothetical protein